MLKVEFPVSPAGDSFSGNTYVILNEEDEKKVLNLPSMVHVMIGYSFLEKKTLSSSGAMFSSDRYTFYLTSEKVLDEFLDLIASPVYLALTKAFKHGLIKIRGIDPLSEEYASLVNRFRRVSLEPEAYTYKKEKTSFVLECIAFSEGNPYSVEDRIISHLCILDTDNNSPAQICLNLVKKMIEGSPLAEEISLMEKIVNAYIYTSTWPLSILLFTAFLCTYYKPLAFSLVVNIPEFKKIITFVGHYDGENLDKCEKIIGQPENKPLKVPGLRVPND